MYAALHDAVAARLRPSCGHMTIEAFDMLVHSVCAVQIGWRITGVSDL